MPFRFRVTSRLPSKRSVSSEHWQDHSPTHKDQTCYCIQVRVMLGDGGGDQPPPPHVWEGDLITDILQEAWPDDCNFIAMVLSPGETILFFSRCSKNERFPYCKARDVEICLGGPFNWPGRSVQIEALRKTVQEGCHAILEAVVEKTMKTRRQGQPHIKTRHPKTPAAAYGIEEWMWGLTGDSDGEPKWNDDINHRPDQRSDHLQQRSWGHGRCRWQRAPHLSMEPSGGSPCSGGNSLDGQSECSTWHSNQMRVSGESGQSGWTGRCFRVKVNLSTFKGKKGQRHCDLLLMALGCVHVLPLWLGWLSFAALCLQIFARIPRRPGK